MRLFKLLTSSVLLLALTANAQDKSEEKVIPDECKQLSPEQRKDPNAPCYRLTTNKGSGATEAFVDYVVPDTQNVTYVYTPSNMYLGADSQTNSSSVPGWSPAVSTGAQPPKDQGGTKEPGTQ